MVKYYGRARQRIGSVNTNQLGLKMSGCPSKIGRQGYISRYMGRRVNCMEGVCGYPLVNGAIWRHGFRNTRRFCKGPASKCAAAAGGIRAIYTPYYKSIAPGVPGCGIPYKNIKKLPSLVFKAGATVVGGEPIVGYIVGGSATPGSGTVESIGTPEDTDGLFVVFASNGQDRAVIATDSPVLKDGDKLEVNINGKASTATVEDAKDNTAKVALPEKLKPGDVVEVTAPVSGLDLPQNKSATSQFQSTILTS